MDTRVPGRPTAGLRGWRGNAGTHHDAVSLLAKSPGSTAGQLGPAITLVWLDAREAIVVRWVEGAPHVERIESQVPVHHRATGRVRHDPHVRHGGGGPPQTAGEPHRLEHLARFLDAVAKRLPPGDDLLLLGPGTVRQHLARRLQELDDGHRVVRVIACESAPRMTHRQLIACLRRALGDGPRRRTADEDLLEG